MKTNYLIFSIFCIVIPNSSLAQFKVYNTGNTAIGTNSSPESSLSIKGQGRGDASAYVQGNTYSIYSLRDNANNNTWGYGIFAKSINYGKNFSVGINGEAFSKEKIQKTVGRSFGVIGSAGYATSGFNYGVFGRLHGNNNGTAIYGTTDDTENGIYISGKYAGVFNGNVHVIGSLSVTDFIKGIVAIPSTGEGLTMRIQNSTADDAENVNKKLSSLDIFTYYKEPNKSFTAQSMVNDTIAPTRKMSAIEIQDYENLHYALSAEQLEKVFPNLVYTNESGEKGINYLEIIPILVKSINELQTEIAELKRNEQQKSKGTETSDRNISLNNNYYMLQNEPNPFNFSTSIECFLPETTREAFLIINNLKGKEIQKNKVLERGKFKIQITSEKLLPGIYLYTLIADGKIIHSRRMIYSK